MPVVAKVSVQEPVPGWPEPVMAVLVPISSVAVQLASPPVIIATLLYGLSPLVVDTTVTLAVTL